MLRLISLVLVAALGWVAWLLFGSLPRSEGRITIAGLEYPVTVTRDEWGIPHIRAESERDLYLAVGFVHAQDRLWQLEMNRRVGQGRLAEILGENALPIDRFMRTLGIDRRSKAGVSHLSAGARELLEAYAAGINAFLEERSGPLPPEFQLLWHSPEPWRIAHSLVMPRLMALDLSKNWRDEALRARLAGKLGPHQLADLFPGQPEDAPITLDDSWKKASAPLERVLRAAEPFRTPGLGSNIWAIGAGASASGHAMLASDPHLRLRAPSVWYLARLETPEFDVTGATMPAMPFVIIGRNDDIAWGFTNSGADVQDLFIEEISADSPGHYRVGDGVEPFETRRERIDVRGGDPVFLDVRESRHGPILSDVTSRLPAGEHAAVALRWTALEEDDRTIEAGFALARAYDWPTFLDALSLFQSPPQNAAYADRQGFIGLALAGRVPMRRSGDGSRPVQGRQGRHDWQGFIPLDEMPRMFDPPTGRLVNANNRIIGEEYPHLLTRDWDPAMRARRLEALLMDTAKVDLERMLTAQNDIHSTLADDFLPLLLETEGFDERSADILQRMSAWDRRMERDSIAALVFARWYRDLVQAIFLDELGKELFLAYRGIRSDAMRHVIGEARAWCDDITTGERRETCADMAADAFRSALDNLGTSFGEDHQDWRWEDAAPVVIAHQPMGQIPVIGRLFDIVTSKGGDASSPDVAHHDGSSPFATISAASMRMVVDWSEPDRLRIVASTGQSGHPASAHYADMTRLWSEGEHISLDLGSGLASQGVRRELRLVPKAHGNDIGG